MGRLLEKIKESKKKSTHIYTLSDILTLLLEEAHLSEFRKNFSCQCLAKRFYLYSVKI